MSLQPLLGDVPKTKFVADFYHRLPYSQPGRAAHLRSLGTWQSLGRILQSPEVDVMVVKQGVQRTGAPPRSTEEAEALAGEGHTVLVRHAERHDAQLAELAAGFARDLDGPVNIHMYATPGGNYGFGWHYDAEEVFILQTTGKKEYALRKNTVNPWPVVEAIPADMRYEREIMPLMRCLLAAGDWLYIPSGYWHMAKADETAISLAVGVMPSTGIDIYDRLRQQLLDSMLWRQRLPARGEASPWDVEQLRAQYRAVVEQLSEDLARQLTDDRFLDQLLKEHDSV